MISLFNLVDSINRILNAFYQISLLGGYALRHDYMFLIIFYFEVENEWCPGFTMGVRGLKVTNKILFCFCFRQI